MFQEIGTTEILIIILLAIIVLELIMFVVVMFKLKNINRRFKNFVRGKDAESMEDAIIDHFDRMEEMEFQQKKISDKMNLVEKEFGSTIHKVGIVRYNAFEDMGGQQSFALALLNHNDSGFILDSVHNREASHVFLREIEDGISDIKLTEEETKALEMAFKSVE